MRLINRIFLSISNNAIARIHFTHVISLPVSVSVSLFLSVSVFLSVSLCLSFEWYSSRTHVTKYKDREWSKNPIFFTVVHKTLTSLQVPCKLRLERSPHHITSVFVKFGLSPLTCAFQVRGATSSIEFGRVDTLQQQVKKKSLYKQYHSISPVLKFVSTNLMICCIGRQQFSLTETS